MTAHLGDVWAVVLAAGEGRRLAPLTRAIYGFDLPKQFAALHGDESLLQATLRRLAPLVPPARTVVVVGREYQDVARRQLRGFAGIDLVLQPRNRDTGPGILLPLLRIQRRDPGARVVLVPSDHHIPRPAPVHAAVRGAFRVAARSSAVTLLGVVPDRAETEYGWIVPGEPERDGASRVSRSFLRRVERFVEKPSLAEAQRLKDGGALWNTFLGVGHVRSYLYLLRTFLPEHFAAFELYERALGSPAETPVLDELYEVLSPANFSSEVLQRAPDLNVAAVEGSGWSDLGSPERVLAILPRRARHFLRLPAAPALAAAQGA